MKPAQLRPATIKSDPIATVLSSSSWLLSVIETTASLSGFSDIKTIPAFNFVTTRKLKCLACILALPMVPPVWDHIPDLPPADEFALELVPAVPLPGAAPAEGDLPLPPLNPVGLEPLLDPAVPLPGLRLMGFDPLLEPVPVAGLALVVGRTLPGAMPGAA